MESTQALQNEIVHFLRNRDYQLIKELGQGACGKTVLLYDDQIQEKFVCKKYLPYDEAERKSLFSNFVREIKLLHQVHHGNVVRVFNYYLYPDKHAGFILMEFIDGANLDDYSRDAPEQVNELFIQAIDGFSYLERSGILHRDIRPGNLLVSRSGQLKIIDLGFGKQVETSVDFQKSITLNWWCQPPKEFDEGRYDFATEVYFVGKLFERLIQQNNISHFKYSDALRKMCEHDSQFRAGSFAEIEKIVRSSQFFEIEFTDDQIWAYRQFAGDIARQITKIETSSGYIADVGTIQSKLKDTYRSLMLEELVPDAAIVLNCLLAGTYFYKKKGLRTQVVSDFLRLLKSSSAEQNRIIIANLHTKLDAVPRYSSEEDDEIPF